MQGGMDRIGIKAGDTFNKWTAIRFDRKDNTSRIRWIFQCECGKEYSRLINTVVNGQSRQCVDCGNKNRRHVIKPGDRFGNWTAIEYIEGRQDNVWRFLCDCGTKLLFTASEAVNGKRIMCRSCSIKDNGRKRRSHNRHMQQGYVYFTGYQDHPNCRSNGTLFEHVMVMSESLGRPLFPHERVHHINGMRDDNDISNLELWSTSQPSGQRVKDKISWMIDFLTQYRYEVGHTLP